jgi:hypothetical protein
MKHLRPVTYLSGAMASAALLVLTLGTPALAQPTWTITPTPTAGSGSALESVYAVSAADAWAAGLQFGSNGGFSQLVEHWNGSAWQIASLPTVTPFSTELSSVSGTSAHDIWAVGYQFTSSSNTGPYPPKMTLIMHWDGTSWTRVPSPNPGSVVSALSMVKAFGPNDAWASGFASDGQNTPVTHFVLHWNGTSWSQVATPAEMTLAGGSSGTDVWFMQTGSTATPWHWNGSSFTREPGPVSATVAAVSPAEAWGTGMDANGGTTLTRWNGSTWSTVQTLPAGESLRALAALSANDVWAVGLQDTAAGGLATLTMQWNGTAWVTVPSPNPRPGSSPVLIGVAAAAPSTVIAVGDGSGTSGNQALAMMSGNG